MFGLSYWVLPLFSAGTWFGEDEEVPFDTPINSKFDGGRATVTSEAINDFVQG